MSTPQINIGAQSLQKGEVRNGKQLVAWDCIQDCVPENCPIGSSCDYYKQNVGGKCSLQHHYLQAFVDMIFSTYRYIGEDDMFKIGMHLVPLYSQLCRQKIVEKAVSRLAYEDAKGVVRIHPIYREMRETMKTITLVWKELGFSAFKEPQVGDGAVEFAGGKAGYGDPNHYATISQNANNKRNVVR